RFASSISLRHCPGRIVPRRATLLRLGSCYLTHGSSLKICRTRKGRPSFQGRYPTLGYPARGPASGAGGRDFRIPTDSLGGWLHRSLTVSLACTAEAEKINGNIARVGSVGPQVPEMTNCMFASYAVARIHWGPSWAFFCST